MRLISVNQHINHPNIGHADGLIDTPPNQSGEGSYQGVIVDHKMQGTHQFLSREPASVVIRVFSVSNQRWEPVVFAV